MPARAGSPDLLRHSLGKRALPDKAKQRAAQAEEAYEVSKLSAPAQAFYRNRIADNPAVSPEVKRYVLDVLADAGFRAPGESEHPLTILARKEVVHVKEVRTRTHERHLQITLSPNPDEPVAMMEIRAFCDVPFGKYSKLPGLKYYLPEQFDDRLRAHDQLERDFSSSAAAGPGDVAALLERCRVVKTDLTKLLDLAVAEGWGGAHPNNRKVVAQHLRDRLTAIDDRVGLLLCLLHSDGI